LEALTVGRRVEIVEIHRAPAAPPARARSKPEPAGWVEATATLIAHLHVVRPGDRMRADTAVVLENPTRFRRIED
jgi:hypothetical protein